MTPSSLALGQVRLAATLGPAVPSNHVGLSYFAVMQVRRGVKDWMGRVYNQTNCINKVQTDIPPQLLRDVC